ncbi:hypothetical protein BO94DRAFT_154031 [Aspergillus sclerotioniger CBS 115572]|uniref:Uncharacterized protein n=1 Tax=Aspergillus sclerotioniger CBS 115572 TaxID=1450535 RepID=A0A317W7X0_9EURO|nr:hypothetical protein BO94DRAFT_154031 [Aspergillus sclerotioniger CBS 115572]PWY80250.1 hypothetical protein BO94DRAFT_154031 [Aspergillus sclerotioniger CBS 115572]
MVPITQHERPKTDYERWLEAQNGGAPAGDQAQYHPPSPDSDKADTSSAESGSGYKHSHGMFLHHTSHHQSAATAHGRGVGVGGLHGPHGLLHGVLPGYYGMVAMKVAVLALLVVVFLRVGRFLKGKRCRQCQGQGPRTPQVGGLGMDLEKKYLV